MRDAQTHKRLSRHLFAFARLMPLALVIAAALGCQSNPVLRKQGIDAFDAGRIDEADERFSTAIAQDPTDWKSLYYLGKVRLAQNRPTAARLHLEQALSLREDNDQAPEILDALAEAIYRQSDYNHLVELLKHVSRERNTSRDYLRQGRYLTKMGDMDAAHVALRTAVRLAPANDTVALVALADFYESVGDKQEAVNALRAAYTINPHDSTIADHLRALGIVPGPSVTLPAEQAP